MLVAAGIYTTPPGRNLSPGVLAKTTLERKGNCGLGSAKVALHRLNGWFKLKRKKFQSPRCSRMKLHQLKAARQIDDLIGRSAITP
jgi:hypothetical protein